MPKISFVLLSVSAACFAIYLYYQVEFCLQPSWISHEAFRLQDTYFKWMGAAFASGCTGVIWWHIASARS